MELTSSTHLTTLRLIGSLRQRDNVYFGASDGSVKQFDDTFRNDDGVAIVARLELAFTAFGMENWFKSIFFEYFTIAADSRTSLTVKYATDEDNELTTEVFKTGYIIFDFNNLKLRQLLIQDQP